jgi:hypothetical protein
MTDPQTLFEKLVGKKEHATSPEQWEKDFHIYFCGWKDGYEYSDELKKINNDMNALAELQRGII